MKRVIGVMAAAIGLSTTSVSGQYLMVAVSGSSTRVMLLSRTDGSIVNNSFIPDSVAANFATPKEALQVGNEIWVSDQVADSIYRFTASLTPQHIGTITGNFDNIRGIARAGNFAFVANDGDTGAATQNRVYKMDLQGNIISEFVVTDPYDIVPYQGGILVSTFQHDLLKFDLDGNPTGDLVLSAGTAGSLASPQQVLVETGDSVWATSSLAPTNGLFRFSSSGVQEYFLALPNLSVCRGVAKLDNGLLILALGSSTAGGLYTLNPATNELLLLHSGSSDFQFINTLDLAPATVRCQPADIAADNGTPLPTDPETSPNGGVNEGDYNCFFTGFFDAAAHCDIANDNASPRPPFGEAGVNGGVNEGDYNLFFIKFFDGCP